MMKSFLTAILAIALLIAGATTVMGQKPTESNSLTPVLIELFTSEGCSSCPPADRLLERFDGQPIQGAELIVLSEHVDYWNHIGWKDPYSSAFYSARQQTYGNRFRSDGVYTPQMVVDGTTEFVGSDSAAANRAIGNALRAPKLRVNLSLAPVRTGDSSQLQVDIGQLESSLGIREAEVYIAYSLNRAESQVSAGENAGHKLTHVSVVKKMVKIGEIKNGEKFSSKFPLDHPSGIDAKNGRVIVFVQEPHQGRVIGVGLTGL